MAGLVPAIHVFSVATEQDVDATATRTCPSCALLGGASRVNPTCADKRGHDESNIETVGVSSFRLEIELLRNGAPLRLLPPDEFLGRCGRVGAAGGTSDRAWTGLQFICAQESML